jgi:squalene synthase HpnC
MSNAPAQVIKASMTHAKTHYENFPVASILLPKHLREPIALIYSFARQADDFADEGDLSPEQRLALLDGFKQELSLLQAYIQPNTDFFKTLGFMLRERNLPFEPLFDLLDAFSQDVTQTRYQNFGAVMDYCRRSANPVGRLLLHLYGAATPRNIGLSDAICSALQIINFLQDIAIDYQKDRIYLAQDEMAKYQITESQIAQGLSTGNWSLFMEFQINRARRLLQAGAPLGLVLPGRMGLEMRMIIAGGERILKKLHQSHGDVFKQRPVLTKKDWLYMLYRAISKR